ncbi:hypothetical protein [Streptomyces sp. NPDC002324]
MADSLGDDIPQWVSYLDAAEHDATRPPARTFTDALEQRKPGVRPGTRHGLTGLTAALFNEGESEQAAAEAQPALDDAGRVDSTLAASRFNALLDAVRPYRATAVDEVPTRAADVAAARPTSVAA